jgi:F0F1-type ATP synthase assembly protein I
MSEDKFTSYLLKFVALGCAIMAAIAKMIVRFPETGPVAVISLVLLGAAFGIAGAVFANRVRKQERAKNDQDQSQGEH